MLFGKKILCTKANCYILRFEILIYLPQICIIRLKNKNIHISACESGRHGASCGMTCGKCRDELPCNSSTGICENGCKPGWDGKYCTQKKPIGMFAKVARALSFNKECFSTFPYLLFKFEYVAGG
jgi:hypothetical protein